MALVLPLLLVSTVWAQSDNTTGSTELQDRLNERKNNLQTKLDSFEQQTVKLRCEAAQAKIKVAQGRLNGKGAERMARYNNAAERLTNLSAKLKVKGVDTASLDSQIGELQTMIKNYNELHSGYKQQIDDLVAMNCGNNPEAFKATLLEAREDRAKVVQAASDIKTFVTSKIKPTLLSVREQVNTHDEADNTVNEGSHQ
jgi:hypothetical protein